MGDGTRTFGGRLESCSCPLCYFTNFYLRVLLLFNLDSSNGFQFQQKIYYAQYLSNTFGDLLKDLDINDLVDHIPLD